MVVKFQSVESMYIPFKVVVSDVNLHPYIKEAAAAAAAKGESGARDIERLEEKVYDLKETLKKTKEEAAETLKEAKEEAAAAAKAKVGGQ